MPFNDNDNVIFGAEIDSDQFISDIDKVIGKHREWKTAAEDQSKSFDKATSSMKNNSEALKNSLRIYDDAKTKFTQVTQLVNKPFSPQWNNADIMKSLQQFKDATDQAIGGLNFKDFRGFDELKAHLIESKEQFEDIQKITEAAKDQIEQMFQAGRQIVATQNNVTVDQLSPAQDDEVRKGLLEKNELFKDLNQVVKTGTQIQEAYNEVVGDGQGRTQSYRSELQGMRLDLKKLEEAGLENTDAYKQQLIQASLLERKYVEMQTKIVELSKDTKNIDFGLAAARAAATGFELYAGTLQLLGISTEDAEEAQRKLLAVMALVNGARELTELLSKKNILAIVGEDFATRGLAAVNRFLAVSFGEAATAASIFRGILITTGIGALVIGLGVLITKFIEWREEQSKLADQQKLTNDIMNSGEGEYERTVVELDKLKEHIRLAKDGLIDKKAVVNEYNESIGKTTGTVKDLGAAEQGLIDNAPDYIRMMTLKAVVTQAMQERAKDLFDQQKASLLTPEQADEQVGTWKKIKDAIAAGVSGGAGFGLTPPTAAQSQAASQTWSDRITGRDEDLKAKLVNKQGKAISVIDNIITNVNSEIEGLLKQHPEWKLIPPPKDNTKEVENLFKQRLLELKTKLNEVTDKGLIDFETIRTKVSDELDKTIASIDSDLKAKKLTKPQADILRKLAGQISDAELQKEFADYERQRSTAQKEIDQHLFDIQMEGEQKRIDGLKGMLAKGRAELGLEREKTNSELRAKEQADLDKLQEQFEKGIFGDPTTASAQTKFNDTKNKLIGAYRELFAAANAEIDNKEQELAAKVFQETLQNIDNLASSGDEHTIEDNANKATAVLASQYERRLIDAKTYQQKKTLIEDQAEIATLRRDRAVLQSQQALILIRMNSLRISQQERDELQKQEAEINSAIVKLNSQIAQANAKQKDDSAAVEPAWLTTFNKVVAGYDELTNAVGSFYDEIAQRQQQALDRELAFQQIRVDRARILAERGNAEALELEEQRQDELLRKREEAGRKQMAIDNAIRASQAALAAISAVASAALSSGPLLFITIPAALAAVIGAISAAISFANSLAPVSTSFFHGVTDVPEKPNRSVNKHAQDTVQAWLAPHEAVIPQSQNKEYHDTVEAIYHRSIPPEVLNNFVKLYPTVHLPSTNYERLTVATERSYGIFDNNTELSKKLDLVNENLVSMTDTLGRLRNVDIRFDREGFAVSLIEELGRQQMIKRS